MNLLAPGVVSAVGFTEARSGFKEIRNIQRLDMQLSPFLRILYLVMARLLAEDDEGNRVKGSVHVENIKGSKTR